MGWVLFFDGDCAFCSQSVKLVLRLDPHARVAFAPLQGQLAKERGFSQYASSENGTMVFLRESDGEIFTHSDAWIELANALGGGWRVLTLARIIPKPLRDGFYCWVARNRFRFMGKTKSCALPDPELLRRMRE